MTIARTNGEMLHGNNEQFLDETNLPDHIRSIFFSAASVPRALNIVPVSHIVLFLDFTVPPFFDFGKTPEPAYTQRKQFRGCFGQQIFVLCVTSKAKGFLQRKANRGRLASRGSNI